MTTVDIFPDLTWTNRPDMAGSEAPEALQDVWVATMLAMRDVHGGIKRGACFVNVAAALPLVQDLFDGSAVARAGYAAFVDERGLGQWGFRWRPDKWAKWVDASAYAHLSPIEDAHVWVETETHVIDLTTRDGEPGDLWPPMLCWPKWRLLKHPNDATRMKPGEVNLLLWRRDEALAAPMLVAEVIAAPMTVRAREILAKAGSTGHA